MDVWVLEASDGVIDYGVTAVFASLDAAMAAHPGEWVESYPWVDSYPVFLTLSGERYGGGRLELTRYTVIDGEGRCGECNGLPAVCLSARIKCCPDCTHTREQLGRPPADLTQVPPIKPSVG